MKVRTTLLASEGKSMTTNYIKQSLQLHRYLSATFAHVNLDHASSCFELIACDRSFRGLRSCSLCLIIKFQEDKLLELYPIHQCYQAVVLFTHMSQYLDDKKPYENDLKLFRT